MKVLLVNKFHYLKGGSERYYFTLAEAFERAGHQVIFFAMKDEKNIPCETEKFFVSNASVGGGLKSKLKMVMHIAYSKEAYKKMTALLKQENPDLVILNLVHKQITCSVIDAIKDFNKDLPIFWTMHDLIAVCPSYTMLDGEGRICEKCLDKNFKHCTDNRCIKGSKLMSKLSTYEANVIRKKGWYDKVDKFICPSNFYKKKLQQADFTKSDIVWLRNPLSSNTVYELNAHDDGYILYFGRLTREKGVKTLIDAMQGVDYKLEVLGTGPIEDELKDYVTKNGILNVTFEGFKQGNELETFIRNARCIVLPSEWYENGPYSAMEAMALGKPLIVSNKGGLPELVEDGVNGYVYNTTTELKQALIKVINAPEQEYSSLCENSLKKAKEYFNPKDYVEQLIALMKKDGNSL
ncbi:MAG: glycosyltransferase family 4 protein [Clostridiales bacterium]|nr:glycosyltransferase family 4 protein [Clostridiales bacterium]